MRLLYVGDPHITVEEMADCETLADAVVESARIHDCPWVFFAGDLGHTHAVLRVEVMAYWRRLFRRLHHAGRKAIALVGNHDIPSTGAVGNGLMAYQDMPGVTIVDKPMIVPDTESCLGFIPYCPSNDLFVAGAEQLYKVGVQKTLFGHQTCDGSRYENGFYAGEGVDPALIPQELFISGHIHEPQSFGKVWYPGAPRWRTLSDANSSRALRTMEFDRDGGFVQGTPIPSPCRQIRRTVIRDGVVVDGPVLDDRQGAVWHVDLHGDGEINRGQKTVLEQQGFRVRSFDLDTARPRAKESEGVQQTLWRWLKGFKAKNGTSSEVLGRLVAESLGWSA